MAAPVGPVAPVGHEQASPAAASAVEEQTSTAAAPGVESIEPIASTKEVAQVQDHVEAPNATSSASPVSLVLDHVEASSASPVALVLNEHNASTRPRLLLGPVIDGQTGWSITAPPGGWCPIVRKIRRQLGKKGAKVLELPSPGGGKVEASVEMEDGNAVLWASDARIEIPGNYANVQILARAAWTEGPARWCARVLPLATLWLLGTVQSEEPDWTLIENREPGPSWLWLDSIGWRQANVEIALDFVDWLFDADDHKSLVTKLKKYPIVQGEVCESINWGYRHKNLSSGSLYAKGLLLDVLRGDPPQVTSSAYAGLVGTPEPKTSTQSAPAFEFSRPAIIEVLNIDAVLPGNPKQFSLVHRFDEVEAERRKSSIRFHGLHDLLCVPPVVGKIIAPRLFLSTTIRFHGVVEFFDNFGIFGIGVEREIFFESIRRLVDHVPDLLHGIFAGTLGLEKLRFLAIDQPQRILNGSGFGRFLQIWVLHNIDVHGQTIAVHAR